jgi:hypothetical protein
MWYSCLDKWAGIISKYGVVPQESLLLVHKCVVGIINHDDFELVLVCNQEGL